MKVNRVYIFLTGGLGNQLFQIAAAKSLNPKEIKVITSIGHPRLNKEGRSEVFNMNIGEEVSEHKLRHTSKFISKVFGYLLRSSIDPTRIEKLFLRCLMRYIGAAIIRYEIKDKFKIFYSEDIGFTDIFEQSETILLVGYFQSYKYLDTVRLKTADRKYSIFDQQIYTESQVSNSNGIKLIVHFRLGDYKFNQAFGVIDPIYYVRAIKKLTDAYYFDEILIFSDEIDVARKLLIVEFPRKVTWVDPLKHDTVSSFELMRHGHAFIIGNSTFSWWAATLALKKPISVVAPNPWFAGIAEPRYLIPDDWDRMRVNFIA
jgi:hypothetical protein